METIKIKPSHPSQGEYVLIEEKDFDPAIHRRLDDEKPTVVQPQVVQQIPVRRGRPRKVE